MKMCNTLSLLSRSPAVTTPPQAGPPIPSIRLITATPSATGLFFEASISLIVLLKSFGHPHLHPWHQSLMSEASNMSVSSH